MSQRAFGTGEVDKHVSIAQRGVDIAADDNAGGAAVALADVAAHRRTALDIERRLKREIVSGECRFDQRLSHPAARTGDRKARGHFLKMSQNQAKKPRSSALGSRGSVLARAPRLRSATDGGISSPSQRASLPSTK